MVRVAMSSSGVSLRGAVWLTAVGATDRNTNKAQSLASDLLNIGV
jgi:hypothetical protein